MKAIYKDPVMLREAAEARVHSMCFGYLDSGGDDEVFSINEIACNYKYISTDQLI